MKVFDLLKTALAIVMMAVAVNASAHHSFAMFNTDQELSVTGVVTTFSWRNPHVMIDLNVVDKDGTTTGYRIESGSVNLLMREGWKPNAIKKGDEVTIVFNPLKNGQAGGLLIKVIRADGSVINGV